MLEKTLRVNQLIGYYWDLLTAHQQELVQLYYADDLSLAEIAEQYEISRQAVHRTVKQAEASLEEYEAKLGLLVKAKERRELLDQLASGIHTRQSAQELLLLVDELKELDD
ncbi:hypothetical protein CL176_06660 [Suicoccus acidiformans]|uniref:UPF0122 protein CL176_06660 n=1 Tax=Suicoccus acidiformans TaxID=2036206 RepID=A0A347WKU7_9LACT|nr:YlxM family DNA-binding protein [Suicoccus acidiformans]AXY25704.1 hypothetical protein CL176_06660 [Suicoccus acidiformans]